MRLSEELLPKVEEFFDLIPNADGDVDLDFAMDHLRQLLEEHVDGWFHTSNAELAQQALSQMENIWGMIPATDRKDPDLSEHYEDLIQELDRESASFSQDDEIYGFDEELEEIDDEDADL